jgi:hypothetical protein
VTEFGIVQSRLSLNNFLVLSAWCSSGGCASCTSRLVSRSRAILSSLSISSCISRCTRRHSSWTSLVSSGVSPSRAVADSGCKSGGGADRAPVSLCPFFVPARIPLSPTPGLLGPPLSPLLVRAVQLQGAGKISKNKTQEAI